eukprot:scaffold2066_cov229-Ochromonas_danica.AAC.6
MTICPCGLTREELNQHGLIGSGGRRCTAEDQFGAVSHCQIKCSHIWPKWTKGAGLEVLELSQNEVNNPRNFSRLHATIERAFDKKKLYFERVAIADDPNLIQLKMVILDP